MKRVGEAGSAIEGVITAMVTSFQADGTLDLDGMRDSARFQIDNGAAGLCPLGGTGEPLALTVTEHKQVIDSVTSEAAGRVPVVVGTLLGRQGDIIECGRHARAAGADAIMVIPPYFVVAKPAHIRRHFEAIAEKVDLPMVLFHGPSRSGVRLETDFILELVEAIPQFVAIKETSGDLTLSAELLRSARKDFRVLQGFDELVLPTFAIGGHGAVLSLGCLLPNLFRRLHDSYAAGDLAAAQKLQLEILPLCRVIYSEPNPGPLKLALQMAGRPAGATRPPIYAVSAATREALERLVPRAMKAESAARDARAV
jgi:4-hydroxy-tetrahydrodipicolinate synthase